jgi:hypothetical protein
LFEYILNIMLSEKIREIFIFFQIIFLVFLKNVSIRKKSEKLFKKVINLYTNVDNYDIKNF